jgi:hypothetical protein
MLAAITDPVRMVLYKLKGIESRINDEDNAAPFAPVTAIGTAFRHKLFAPKTGAAVTARPTTGKHTRTIDKHDGTLRRAELLGSGIDDVDTLPAFSNETELHHAIFKREKRVVLTPAYVIARGKLRTTLTNENIARNDLFAAVLFDAQPLRFTIATVT